MKVRYQINLVSWDYANYKSKKKVFTNSSWYLRDEDHAKDVVERKKAQPWCHECRYTRVELSDDAIV